MSKNCPPWATEVVNLQSICLCRNQFQCWPPHLLSLPAPPGQGRRRGACTRKSSVVAPIDEVADARRHWVAGFSADRCRRSERPTTRRHRRSLLVLPCHSSPGCRVVCKSQLSSGTAAFRASLTAEPYPRGSQPRVRSGAENAYPDRIHAEMNGVSTLCALPNSLSRHLEPASSTGRGHT